MLTATDWQEAHKGDLHACQCAKRKPSCIADVQSRAVSPHADQNEYVQRNQVRDEDIASPRRDHVSIEQSAEATPEGGSQLDSFNPQVEGEYQEENSDSFVIIAASN